ncbi:MAG: hypothetical protein AAB394_02490 [Patescibacteria group bacterium]
MATLNISHFVTYLSFYREYLKLYKKHLTVRYTKLDDELILIPVLSHITIESLISHSLRFAISNLAYNNLPLRKISTIFQGDGLNKKIELLKSLYFVEPPIFKFLESYIKKSSFLRNKIIHGHEMSYMYSNDGIYKESPLFKEMKLFDFDKHFKEFSEFIDKFLDTLLEIPKNDLAPAVDWDKTFVENNRNYFKKLKKDILKK